MTCSVSEIVLDLINALITVIEEKEVTFRGHSQRVASNCVRFANKLGLKKHIVETLYIAAMLHDIGMVYIPSEIIHKPGELDESEMVMLKQHPVIAEKILSKIKIFKDMLPIIRHHHENYNGSGYPDRLRSDNIPLCSRIIRIVDSYDNMTSSTPNKQTYRIEEALTIIRKNEGPIYDPDLVNTFVEMIRTTSKASSDADKDNPIVKDLMKKIIQKFKNGQVELPILPTIVQQVRDTINAPGANATTIAKVLEIDAVISVRILSVANSVAFRGVEKILTIRQAVPRLGTKETESIVLAIVSKNLYDTDIEQMKDLMERMWTHSLASAFCSKEIARNLNINDLERYFTLGLIHDIGKVPLLQAITKLQLDSDPSLKDLDMPTILGILNDAHARLGSALLKGWNFDDEFVRVVNLHHNPNLSEHTEKSLLIINLANMITRKIGLSLFDDESIELDSIESAKILGLDINKLNAIGEETKKYVQSTSRVSDN